MFDKYLICVDGFRNVITETGNVEGFEVKIRIPYYRGVPLSCVDEIVVKIHGQTFTNDDIRFTVKSGSFLMSEMSTVSTRRWNLDEDATLRIRKPGGLTYYDTEVDLTIVIRAPYGKFSGHDKKILTLEDDKYLLTDDNR